jgi:DNA-binding transcriptional MerR regulator
MARTKPFQLSGEVAALTRRTLSTLINWERAGLLVPDRSETGVRLYRPHHVAKALELANRPRSGKRSR